MKKKNVFKRTLFCGAIVAGCLTASLLPVSAKSYRCIHKVCRIRICRYYHHRYHRRKRYHKQRHINARYSYHTIYQHLQHISSERRYHARDIQSLQYSIRHKTFSKWQYHKLFRSITWYCKHPRMHIFFNKALQKQIYTKFQIKPRSKYIHLKKQVHLYQFPFKHEISLYARRSKIYAPYVFNGNPRRKTDREWNDFGGANNDVAAMIRQSLITSTNQIRRRHHLRPYRFSPWLQQIANERVKQVNTAYLTEPSSYVRKQRAGNAQQSDNWIHGMDKHDTSLDDATKLHYSHYIRYHLNRYRTYYQQVSNENAGPIYVGANIHDSDLGHNYTYSNITPNNIGHNITNNMVYHDRYSQNGHGLNICNPQTRYMAVSVKFTGHLQQNYNPQMQGSFIEEFA